MTRSVLSMQLAKVSLSFPSDSFCVRTEASRHHDFDFRVYEVDFDGRSIELKAKVTEGFIAYMMRLI